MTAQTVNSSKGRSRGFRDKAIRQLDCLLELPIQRACKLIMMKMTEVICDNHPKTQPVSVIGLPPWFATQYSERVDWALVTCRSLMLLVIGRDGNYNLVPVIVPLFVALTYRGVGACSIL